MQTRAFVHTAWFVLAYLLLVPCTGALAGPLREQAVSYRVKGYERQRQGDYVGAYTWYQKAMALDPSYATPHNDLGVILEKQGRFEEAAAAYQQALAVNPHYLETHANLAMFYERRGEREKAVYHWLKRYQLGDPSDPWTMRAEERLVALGVLKAHPGVGGRRYARRRVIGEAFHRYQTSLEEFRAITEEYGDWP